MNQTSIYIGDCSKETCFSCIHDNFCQTQNVKTMRAKIEKLKRDWLADPIWDIEESDGFEGWKTELKEFRLAQEAKWQAQEYNRLHNRAVSLGIDNLGSKQFELLKYLENLERIINNLIDRISKLEG